ncbi:MAG: M3 family oligoendopeptidase [Proteobacteria bacterium]|nr:M3 family oligoendopeptidase [Pseudomonadota bacterium]
MATAPTASAADLGSLPEWDLGDLYPGPDAAELTSDIEQAAAAAQAFQDRYAGKIAALDGAGLGDAVAEYERIEEVLGRVTSFAQLYYAGRMEDPEAGRFFQMTQERVNEISVNLLCLALELNRIEDDALTSKMAAPALAHYAPWVRDLRAFRRHQLSDELEKFMHEQEVAGRTAWIRLFDETTAAQRFSVGGRELTSAEALHLLSDKDAARRKQAAEALSAVFTDEARIFALITNTLAKEKEIEDRWRGFARPISSRNLSNHVEDDVVDALIAAVKAAYPDLSHRYYRLKASWLGVDRLDYWDRNAPLPKDDDRVYPWEEAKALVLAAYGDFAPEMAELGRRFFDNRWIDAPVKPGKAPGAFSHPTVPSAHPYILLNYLGKSRDVMTLAHELGHGVHQLLAAPKGALMAQTPLTLAETASVFGEQLAFRSMLDAEMRPERRRILLAGKIEDMLNTVVRQIAFCEFERLVHDERRSGELTPERIGEIWMAVQEESLGPAFRFEPGYRHYWSYIPHFIHSPFYVYAYAFGDCLVNALYAVYQEAEAGFQQKYLEMLKAGGTLRHKELLAPFGLDASEPAFWSKGLGVVKTFIDELEETM